MKEFNHFKIENKRDNIDTVMLIGPNGSGKSQSLFFMGLELQKKGIPCITYISSKQDAVDNVDSFEGEDHEYAVSQIFRSEGERMVTSFSLWFQHYYMPFLGYIRGNEIKEYWFLIDELDSGLSYDRIKMEIKELLKIQSLEKKNGRTMNLVFTSNSYEFIYALREFKEFQLWAINKEQEVTEKINSFEDFIDIYKERYTELSEEV